MSWLPLTLLCAFSLAAADAATKRWLSDYTGTELVLVRFAVPGLLLVPLALLYPLPPVPAAFWGWLALLLPLEFAAMWLYMRAIRDAPLHLTLPYLAFTPVFSAAVGGWLLGERISVSGLLGIALVVSGAWLLNLRRGNGLGPRAWVVPFAAIVRERGSREMLVVALIYSLTSVAGKVAMGYATPQSFGPFYFVLLGGAALLLFVLFRPARLGVLRERPMAIGVVGLSMAVMVVTHFLALSMIEVAYMITVKRTSLLFGMAYGALWFGERGLPGHLLAGSLMVMGVGFILV